MSGGVSGAVSKAASSESAAGSASASTSTSTSASNPRTLRRVLRRIPTFLFAVALVAAIALAWRDVQWSGLRRFGHASGLAALGLACVANVGGLAAALQSWREVLVAVAGPVDFGISARIFLLGFVAKFLPGSAWSVVVHMRMGSRAGLSPARMATVYVACLPIGIVTGGVVGILAGTPAFGGNPAWPVAAAAAATALMLSVATGRNINALISAAARVLHRPMPTALPDRAIRRSLAASEVGWLVSGLHLWLIVVVLGGPAWKSLPICVGAFALAVTAGSIAFFLPDGWGAREAVLTPALATLLGWPGALIAALASRAVLTVTEVLAAAVVVAGVRGRGAQDEDAAPDS